MIGVIGFSDSTLLADHEFFGFLPLLKVIRTLFSIDVGSEIFLFNIVAKVYQCTKAPNYNA